MRKLLSIVFAMLLLLGAWSANALALDTGSKTSITDDRGGRIGGNGKVKLWFAAQAATPKACTQEQWTKIEGFLSPSLPPQVRKDILKAYLDVFNVMQEDGLELICKVKYQAIAADESGILVRTTDGEIYIIGTVAFKFQVVVNITVGSFTWVKGAAIPA